MLPGVVSLLAAIYFIRMGLLSPGVEGGMDSYQHYLIARYSWNYPELFLHQWGKPIFTLISSPFSQFGLIGNIVFNTVCMIGSAWLVFLTAIKLKFKYPIFSFLAVLFSPIFFDQIISGLTEPLSALMLSALFYFFVQEKHTAAAIIAGLMPFARSEGFMIMAVAGFYLLLIVKSPKAFLFLLSGSLFMNTLGWIIEGKPLWIFTENPYIRVELEKVNICGSGGISHYFRAIPITFGFVLGGLGLTGATFIVYNRITQFRKMFSPGALDLIFWVIFGSFALYFSVHTIIWFLGKMGSCGYIRVMTVIVPAVAILSNFAIDYFFKSSLYVRTPLLFRKAYLVIFILAGSFMLYEPFWRYGGKYPIEISAEQKLFKEAAEWLKTRNIEDRTLYFLYPYLNILADIDPWDTKRFIEIWGFNLKYAPMKSYVIWDGHFSPNEGKLPLKVLENHPDFTKVKSFKPATPFKTLNNYDFEIHIFERTGSTELE
jgi:hypothetical protein